MTLDEKVTQACHRIEELYNETDGHCYASFSGGKDSTVILALIKMCEEVYTIPPNAIPAVFVNTGIELGVTVGFVKWVKENYYPNVQIIRPEKSFDWVLKNCGKPIRSKLKSEFLMRWKKQKRSESVYRNFIFGKTKTGKNASRTKLADKDMHMLSDDFPIMPSKKCCDILKKNPLKKYAKENHMNGVGYGIRVEEGGARSLNAYERVEKGGKICTEINKDGFVYKMPIIDWTDDDVEQFIEKYNVPLSDAYTKYGFTRTGCCACPFALDVGHGLKYLHGFEPNRYKAMMHWLKDVYIAQNVVLPFDEAYEREREREWQTRYEPMRQEMLRKYRPNSRLIKDSDQLSIFDYKEEEKEEE